MAKNHHEDEGELIVGQAGSSVRLAFAGENVALVLVEHGAGSGRSRVELSAESASRLAVELELAAESLLHERAGRFRPGDTQR
jgi:hypothetical protein